MILLANFNSIKVQLRHYMGFLNTMSNIFQFHKGTIKTCLIFVVMLLLMNFNSIKVQLRQGSDCTLSMLDKISIP